MSNENNDKNDNQIIQWVTSVLNIETKSKSNLDYLNSVLGPIKNDIKTYNDPNNSNINNNNNNNNNNESTFDLVQTQVEELLTQEIKQEVENQLKGSFTHQIVFKIDEKVFIEVVNIYEKVCPGSSLIKLEAYEKKDLWFNLWESENMQDEVRHAQIFSPKIIPTPFKTDTIRLTITGSLYLIDGIEIKGSKLAVESDKIKKPIASSLSFNLSSLIQNELFSDVYFEVEGKIIPAHRNILVCRSEYFKAMLSSNAKFKESLMCIDPVNNPIYLKDIEYDTFLEVLSFLYTGNLTSKDIQFSLLINVMRTADKMNLNELGKLCLFNLSNVINPDNVIQIYKEANELSNVLDNVVNMCHDVIYSNFSYVSRTEDFCSLKQDLMVKILENVVPKLNRLSSTIVNGTDNNEQNDPSILT